ncbi:hypothetical protein V6N13_015880 [Hibiscus sabdariffa]|uniref:Uncharacterized protein n=1 Tax=Hibiscus sabdariffa TaxID=183260 RepID=A0ABR2CX02_9ROSI
MRRTESKTKSARKPLKDLTNSESTRSFSKSEIPMKKMIHKDGINQNDASLDRLILLHSDLSSLLRQIDELVVQAFKLKATEQGRKEIESFMNVISDMLSSLKPWTPRFQKALLSPSAGEHEDQTGKNLEAEIVPFVGANEKECFDVGSPEETTLDSLISPSPLVSWRAADCNVERGRQLFLLTPLPMSKAMSTKRRDSCRSVFEGIASKSNVELASFLNITRDENHDLLEGVEMKATPVKPSGSVVVETDNTSEECGIVSSPVFSRREHSVLVMTPCLKMSPPKSCVLLEPIHESSDISKFLVRKSTPYPVGINKSGFSESSGSEEAPEDLTLKYPELRGIQRTHAPEIRKNELESSPTWLFSPPKSCILLEPPDEKSLDNVGTDHHLPTTGAINQQADAVFSKGNACQETKTINQDYTGINLAPVESTPMWKEPQSTMRRGKQPGESTLKKELWTKFEAVSTFGLRYNTSAVQRTARKGFLDMLDEVSCDEESSISESNGLR